MSRAVVRCFDIKPDAGEENVRPGVYAFDNGFGLDVDEPLDSAFSEAP